MDYDKIFEKDIEKNLFYSKESGKKLMVGRISLSNAIARLSKDEYYTLVTYYEGDILPKEYIPLKNLKSEDGTLFATLNPNTRYLYNICRNGGIQSISRLPDLISGSPRYLLGPGSIPPKESDVVQLEDLIMEQYNAYINSKTSSQRKGR